MDVFVILRLVSCLKARQLENYFLNKATNHIENYRENYNIMQK